MSHHPSTPKVGPTPPAAPGPAGGNLAAAAELLAAGNPARAAEIVLQHLAEHPAQALPLLLLGRAYLGQNQPALAEAALRQALELAPDQAEIHHHLGLALETAGKPEEARGFWARACRLNPNLAPARFYYGLSLLRQQRPGEAARHLQRAVELLPGQADYHYHLAQTLATLGQVGQAEAAFRRAIGLAPLHRAAHNQLGELLFKTGRGPEAARILAGLLERDPGFNRGRLNLAALLGRLGRVDEQIEELQIVLANAPNSLEAAMALGRALYQARRHAEAQTAFEKSLEIDPRHSPALLALGEAHYILGRKERAIEIWQQTVASDPDNAEAWFFLGNHHRAANRLLSAADCFRRVCRLAPGRGEAFNNLAHVLLAAGQVGEAREAYRRAAELMPDSASVAQNHILALHYDPAASLADIKRASLEWAARFTEPPPPRPAPPPRQTQPRPLKVGYVSGDLRGHPVGHFLQGVIGAHDRTRVLPFCYDNHHRENTPLDPVAAEIKTRAQAWRPIKKLGDREAAELIAQDGIDLLIDLSGHTTKNRLSLFAQRPAPVAATWLGYTGTLGLSAMDYIICDPWVVPMAEEPHYLETPARLPHCYLHFTRPAADIPLLPPPAEQNGFVTFGSFNRLAKQGPGVLETWAAIMARVPESRLFLNTPRLGSEEMRDMVRGIFADRGVGPERLRLAPGGKREDLLAAYRQVDLCLDPFPYGGGITTIEALWMGAPVLTISGDRFVSHASESFLMDLGLYRLVARGPEDYVERAVTLGNDPAALAGLRHGLRGRLLGSAICDTALFTRNLEDLFFWMWRQSAAGGGDGLATSR